MNTNSLRTRSLITVLAVVLPVLIVYVYISHSNLSHQLGRRLDGRMGHELTMLKEAVQRSGGDNARLREIVELMPIDIFPQQRLFGIWTDGERALASDGLPFESAPDAAAGYSNVRAGETDWRLLVDSLPPSAATNNRRVVVVVADPMSIRQGLIRGGAIDQLWPLLIAVPLLIVGIYIALARSLRPLTRLADQIRKRSAEQLQPVATDGVPSEALPIAESVNALMARLAESIERERRFTADAAHELRTPLTALKAHAQVALRATDENLRRDTLRSIARTVNRTDRLISQLLMLARLDPEVSRIDAAKVDLGRVAAQTLSDLHGMAEARGQRVTLAAEPETSVRGSATALAILARNIVENAIQYSNDGAPIDVRVFRDGEHGVLEVSDTGPGIPDEAKKEVFSRFRRLPDAKVSGTGLGLSIVQRIAELHDGEVLLQNKEEGAGLRATIRIPRAA
jgi:signal transduction histidine kinase